MLTLDRQARRRHRLAISFTAITLLTLALLFPAAALAGPNPSGDDPQQDDVLFGVDKFAKGAAEANEVTLNKAMLGLAGGMMNKNKDGRGKALMEKMDSVLVRDYEYAAAGAYRMEDVEQVRKRLDASGWSHLVKTRSATETTDVCVKTDEEGVMSEMVIINAEPKELSFIHLKGHMTAGDLGKMSGSFGGPADPTLQQRSK